MVRISIFGNCGTSENQSKTSAVEHSTPWQQLMHQTQTHQFKNHQKET